MTNQEIIEKLNQNNNFHLTLKVIQFVDDNLLFKYASYLNNKKSYLSITNLENSYELLKKAYEEKIDYVLCNEKINFLLPLVSVINLDDTSIIKPTIPVKYLLKDNKIIQHVKTICNKKMSVYQAYKTEEQLFEDVYNNK